LSSMVGETDEERASKVVDALNARLGPESFDVTTLVLDPPEPGSDSGEVGKDTRLLMQAVAKASSQSAERNGSKDRGGQDLNAIVSAEFAVRTAELTAGRLAEISLHGPGGEMEITSAIEAATEALDLRLDHLEHRIGEITEMNHRGICDWTDRLDDRVETIVSRLAPLEWLVGKILSRIDEVEAKITAAETDKLSDPELNIVALTDAFSERTEPFKEALARIDQRLEMLEEPDSAPLDAANLDLTAERKQTKKSISTLKAQMTALNKKHDQIAVETDESLDLIRRAINDILTERA
ncbi:MAG: hypothetical protein AAGH68_05205, partial [Pseudomonadota bacterium]